MIFLNKFSFYFKFIVLFLFSSCHSQIIAPENKNIENKIVKVEKGGGIEFEEVRRLNFNIELKEVSVLKSFQDILSLYRKFENPDYAKSYPLPGLQEDELIIVLKPPLTRIKYGDIEIKSISLREETLIINYKEIENWEYKRDLVSDPIVILKISERFNNIELKSQP